MSGKKTKTARFNKDGIESLPDNKPVVYKIENRKGENIYTGSAKRGRVEKRIKEHLSSGPDPIRGGAKVKIQQKSTIAAAKKTETRSIARSKPRYNKIGKGGDSAPTGNPGTKRSRKK
jgi:excinuclease UvrABC nuclease subunit